MNWIAIGAGLMCLSGSIPVAPDPLPGWPRLMLWAWERPEDLRFLDPHSTGVAYLAGTITWGRDSMTLRRRLQPLRVSPGTRVVAVVRLESRGDLPETDLVTSAIIKSVAFPDVDAVQVDFDARVSEREWYSSLLRDLRERLPVRVPLTMTALVSWCQHEDWLERLPVTDAIPMLFRMGVAEPREVREFRSGHCRASVGIATDELPAALPRGRRIFVFHPRPWDEDTYRAVVRMVARWQ
ncbi:MAG: hypothetical protein C5B51_26050 [Terriglobia bacterium]|nr:MAG: hypothetical protein C5B51_26050 [Terriglobia bacterium]